MLTKKDLEDIKNIVQYGVRVELQAELRSIKKDIAKVRKDLDTTISLFDKDHLTLKKRVTRIEDHIKLPPIFQ